MDAGFTQPATKAASKPREPAAADFVCCDKQARGNVRVGWKCFVTGGALSSWHPRMRPFGLVEHATLNF